MKLVLFGTVAILAAGWGTNTLACAGPAAHDVSISFDGQRFIVTNTGREWVQVDFAAYGATYNLQLGPGQSDIPRSPGMFTQPMFGYESCIATLLPVSTTGVTTLRR